MVRSSNASAGLRSLERKGLITAAPIGRRPRHPLFVTDDARQRTAPRPRGMGPLLNELLPRRRMWREALHVLELLDDAPAERAS
ncbi:hypothetical protein FAM22021_000773 [Propionibacterium freudenreichii]|nr:hypothetical protein [Propionibacterium freudenreichii]